MWYILVHGGMDGETKGVRVVVGVWGWGGWGGSRGESYPSRGQSLAVRVWAHGQGTVESHTSICSTVSVLEGEIEREKESAYLSIFGSLLERLIQRETTEQIQTGCSQLI